MAPDLNSLPPSQSPVSVSPIQARPIVMMAPPGPPSEAISVHTSTPPSPHSPSLSSLQAAATINSGFRNSPDHNSPRFERRRSSLMMNMHLTDPNLPGPGEMAQHHRAPSLGEIHQQLENEQEAQVNRLLHMIRSQQDQITSLQSANPSSPSETSAQHSVAVHNDSTSEFSTQLPAAMTSLDPTQSGTRSRTSSVGLPLNNLQQQQTRVPPSPRQRPISLSRNSSSRLSGTGDLRSSSQSPMLRPVSSAYDPQREDWLLGGARDESAFYQAETQMLTRENQMLKQRIRELERQLGDTNASPTSHSAVPPHFAAVSPLAGPPVVPDAQPSLM